MSTRSAPEICLLAGVLVAMFAASADAEQIKFNYTKTTRQTLSSTSMTVGDAPAREMVQAVHYTLIGKSTGAIELLDEMVYEQDEQIAGSGTHRGFSVNRVRGGGEIHQRWEGTHKTVMKEGGQWDMTYSGKSAIIGGTGKYKSAKGSCDYAGKATQDSAVEDNTCVIEY